MVYPYQFSVRIFGIIFCLLLNYSITLFAQSKGRQAVSMDSTVVDSTDMLLEAEFARELAAEKKTSTSGLAAGSREIRGLVSRSGSTLNPKISAIGTFLGAATQENAASKPLDIGLQEVEIVFDAYVDPYTKATFIIGFGDEQENPFAGPDEAAAFDGEFSTELEEGYLTTLSLPFSLQLKAGKFLGNFGKINKIHPHAWNFIDQPLMYANYFGEEGLLDRGLSLSWLVPNPVGLYQELTLEATSGAVASPSFTGRKDLLYLIHLKNYVDLNENTTLELGFSGIRSSNDRERHKSHLGAIDLTLRWKPLRRNRYKSFEWMSEALLSRRDTATKTINSTAFYSFLRYQLSRRFFIGGRYDYAEFPDDADTYEKAVSVVLSFFATEFQKLDLQYQYGSPAGRDTFSRILLRSVFIIGAHGAHKY